MLRNLKSFNLPEIEEKVAVFWKEKGIFEKTLKPNRKGANGKTFNFWEGPPTANGRPGIHHVLARSFKDVIPRFKTMQGFHVPRKAGWDTHGLPVELQVEKQLGLSSKKDIEKYGIAAFNKACKESVWAYKSEWEKLTERMGFWLDMKDPYVTYHTDYIETLWHIIQQFSKRKLLYEGHKIVPWCPRCGTALSSHELAQGYKTVRDDSVYVKFRLKNPKLKGKSGENAYILSWTTTPWTLPGNVALAVGNDITYSAVRVDGAAELLILAQNRIEAVLHDHSVEIVHDGIPGKDLVGLEYEPLFTIPSLRSETSYKIYPAGFVTTSDGTGVVHTAVMYGEDDYQLGKKIGLPQKHTVDDAGKFTSDVKEVSGRFVKSKETEKMLFAHLEKNGNLFAREQYEHEYPHCWRCDTPLLYYARTSWFVRMSELRANLVASNKQVHWVPEHIQEGRFGEWIQEVKDWNFSRERYWGTPLPIWRCAACAHTEVIGSIGELAQKADRRNALYIMRHGEGTANLQGWLAGGRETGKFISKLTENGKKKAKEAAQKLKKEKIDIIYASPFYRTKQTAEIIAKELGIKVVYDKRLIERDFGVYNHKKVTDYHLAHKEPLKHFAEAPEKGETLEQVRKRIYGAAQDIYRSHEGKRILIVSHGDPLWMLASAARHFSNEESLQRKSSVYLETGTFKKLPFEHVPTDDLGYIDPHRPYADDIMYACQKCSGTMTRVPEVADVWFDSGAMPFAQEHFPFDSQKNKMPKSYPADYISEAVDQTRGWFYTLLAVATALGLKTPYKNVICLGLIHDKNGQKMSKSRGNVVDPWSLIQKYGIDSIRWYFYTLNDPGEPKNFDENDVQKTLRRFLMVVYNSFAFLDLYGKKKISLDAEPKAEHVLDAWILQRLNAVTAAVTNHMNAFTILPAAQELERFADELSRWYIRRSRRRLQKNADMKDWERASAVLAYTLLQYAKLLAPFVPFFAEALYRSITSSYAYAGAESVHLEIMQAGTKGKKEDMDKAMAWARELSSKALAKRAELQIKVRQPLAKLSVNQLPKTKRIEDILAIVRDEVNVKEVALDAKLGEEFVLDTDITPELKAEGTIRELVRAIQDLRQEAGYVPKDLIELWVSGNGQLEQLVQAQAVALAREIGAKKVSIGQVDKADVHSETKINEYKAVISLRRVS